MEWPAETHVSKASRRRGRLRRTAVLKSVEYTKCLRNRLPIVAHSHGETCQVASESSMSDGIGMLLAKLNWLEHVVLDLHWQLLGEYWLNQHTYVGDWEALHEGCPDEIEEHRVEVDLAAEVQQILNKLDEVMPVSDVSDQCSQANTADVEMDSGELDVFSMLSGMVHLNTSSNMGALLVANSIHLDPVEHGEGESLFNVLNADRDASNALVAEIISECSHDNWSLRIDDIVFVGQETRPSIVMRNGFDSYEREVRVRGSHDNRNLWSTGRWVPSDRCYLLEPGDLLQATADIEDCTEQRNVILVRSRCRFVRQDVDGDYVLKCGSRQFTIFAADLDKLFLE